MTNSTIKTIIKCLLLIAAAAGVIYIMKHNAVNEDNAGYIGKSEITVENGRMTPEALLAFGRLSDPQISPDGKYILYGVSYTSIEENRSCRNLFVIPVEGGEAVQLTKSGKSISNARWCDGGKKIIYLQGGQIYAADLDRNFRLSEAVCLTDVPAGVGEFKLSPDESSIMYVSYVKSHVDKPSDVYSDLDKANAYSTENLMYRHWDHWVEEIPHTYLASLDLAKGKLGEPLDILGGSDVLFELPTEPFSGLEQLSWSPDGRYIAYSCRKLEGKNYAFSTNTGIYVYDTLTGETRGVKVDGGYDTCPFWAPDGSRLAWISMERDGYEADRERILMCDLAQDRAAVGQSFGLKFGPVREITGCFKYNASEAFFAEDSKTIYFSALTEGLKAIWRVDSETAVFERLTGEDQWYDFGSPFHMAEVDGSQVLYTTYCSMDFPTEIVAVSPSGLRQITHENDHILSQLAEHRTEQRWIKTVDGKDMLTWVLLPPNFDENKVYPSILICLGGPQGTLSQGWSYRWNYRLMCSQDFVVVLPNRRGTTAFGQEWTEQISGDYCGLNMQDYLTAARELKAEPYVGKMAACGASYGGWSVYYLCGNHENTFDAFIAHCGIFNQEHMFMTTEELWFPNWDNGGLSPNDKVDGAYVINGLNQSGAPWSDKAETKRHYAHSAHKFIKNWNKPLLVIHGGRDFRVPYDQGMAAFNCAQMMGVPSKMIVFPEENHWVLRPQNALFWHREYFDWLNRWL